MQIRRVVAGSVLAAGLGVAGLFGSATAFADVSTNGTTNDATGYGVANHIANFNGDHNGVGHLRSTQTGSEISGAVGVRTPTSITKDTQGSYPKISNNP